MNKLHLELSSQGEAGKCSAIIEDTGQILQADIASGKFVDVWVAKALSFSDKFFTGRLGKRSIVQSAMDLIEYDIECDHITSRLSQRIVHFARIQKRLADGITVDNTDNSTLIDTVVKEIIQQSNVYPTGEPTIENDDGIGISGVESTSLRIPEIIVDYKPATDPLRELADHAARTFWVDNSKILNFKAPKVVDSGILFTDNPDRALAQSWDPTKLGTILQDENFEIIDDPTEIKNRIFGIGGDAPVIDRKQETTSGGQDALDSLYRAQKFSPKELRLAYVAVYIDKLGSPTIDLEGEIREDNNNSPQGGSLVKVFKVPIAQIGAAGWYIADVGADKINTSKDHWLILYKKGNAANTFRWYRDSQVAATRATSTDGVTWTVTGSTYSYAFRTYSATRLLAIVEDSTNISTYGLRETVISDPRIVEKDTMINLLTNIIATSAKLKRSVRGTIYPPDTLALIGQGVRIENSKLSLDDSFEITGLSFDFEEGIPSRGIGIEAVKFV